MKRPCRIRLAAPADAAAVREIYAPFVETTPVSFEVEPPSTAEMADRIETTLREYPWLVCEAAGTVIGYAAASSLRSTPPYRWTVELSVYVEDAAQRSGIGTALYASLLSVLSVQGYRNAYAVTTLPNPASVALHERFGFEPVGTFPAVGYKHGRWHDIRWWYRRLDPESAAKPDPNRESAASESESIDPSHPADPALPMPLPDLRARDGDELGAALRVGESSLS